MQLRLLLIGFLCLISATVFAQEQRWDYALYAESAESISWESEGQFIAGKDWQAFAAESRAAFGAAAKTRLSVFRAAGEKGWELVYCGEEHSDGRVSRIALNCIFKRHRQ